MPNTKIAEKLGTTDKTLWVWQQHPEFQEKMDQIQRMYFARVMGKGMARREKRVEFLNELNQSHKRIIKQRAVKHGATYDTPSGKMPTVAGGDTGLIVLEDRVTGFGESATTVQDEKFDAGFHREVRATIQQISEETGQSVSKHEVTGADGGPLKVTVGVLDDLVARVKQARETHDVPGEEGKAPEAG